MIHMKNVLFLLLGLAASGQAKSSCSTTSDCLFNEVCGRHVGSDADYCLPVSMDVVYTVGLALNGLANLYACARDSDCRSNEVCVRPIRANTDYCLPASMPEDGAAPPPLPSLGLAEAANPLEAANPFAESPDPNLGPACEDDSDCPPFSRCGTSGTCENTLTPRRLKQLDRDNIVPYLPTPLDRRGLKQDIYDFPLGPVAS